MNNFTLRLVSVLLLFTSCSEIRYAYSPVAPNTPGLKEKNDSRLGSAVSIGTYTFPGSSNGQNTEVNFNMHGAYAVTNHVALTASYSGTIKERDLVQFTDNFSSYTDMVNYKRNQFELGAGVFYQLSKNKTIMVECFAGYGFGNLKITDRYLENGNTISSGYYNAASNKFFIQSSLSLHPGKNFYLSLGFKYVNTGHSAISTSYTEQQTIEYSLKDISVSRVQFIEPFLTTNFRFNDAPWLMLQYQLYYTSQISTRLVYYRFSHNNLGVVIDPRLLILKMKK